MTAPQDDIKGLLVIEVIEAKDLLAMDITGFSDPFVDITFGMKHVHKTHIQKKTLNPHWGETHKLLVAHSEQGWTLEFQVWDWDRASSNDFLGTCFVDVAPLFDATVHDLWLDLKADTKHAHQLKHDKPRGKLHLQLRMMTHQEVEKKFWEGFAQHFDVDGTGTVDRMEFVALLSTVASSLSTDAIESMYEKADASHHGLTYDEVWKLINNNREASSKLLEGNPNLLWQVYAASDEFHTIGSLVLQKNLSGYVSSEQKSEMRVIMVQDRATGHLVEEKIPHYIEVSLRLMYQSRAGALSVTGEGAKKLLKHLSVAQGKKYNDPRSKKEIDHFVEFHGLNLDEILDPLDSFATFNEFFYRKLKPSARPVASLSDPKVAVSPADCRLNVFPTISEATRLWIKGRHFTLANLLLDDALAKKYDGGSLLIARLAPQDYHRFHIPIDCTIGKSTPYDGTLYTVNPIAIREHIDVYTENKRHVTVLHSPLFGDVLYVAVGATMVGSIALTSSEGKNVKKGDEHGYFAFGGSTVLLLFEAGRITFDEDLLVNSTKPIETLIKMGDRIGVAAR